MGEGMYSFLLSDDKCKNFDRLCTPRLTFIMIALNSDISSEKTEHPVLLLFGRFSGELNLKLHSKTFRKKTRPNWPR